MKKIFGLVVTGVLVFGLTLPANAALINNGDGTISDTVANLMWAQDTRLGGGGMWGDTDWSLIQGLGGFYDWRAPTHDQSCGTSAYGVGEFNCINSEMGSLFYTALGNSAGVSPTNLGDFLSPVGAIYWTAGYYPFPTSGMQYTFYFNYGTLSGLQTVDDNDDTYYVWAVRDYSAPVPEPGTLLLLGSGLAGLVLYRRKTGRLHR